jgi:diguanylate cyclase (GGDEF)-like protein/PAS domain S-box-containing protein
MPKVITPYVIISFISFILQAIVTLIAWSRRSHPGGKSLTAFMASITIWSAMATLQYSSATFEDNLFWVKMMYWGICPFPVFYMTFALEFSGKQHYITRKNIALLFIVPVIGFGLVWTNEWHHLIFKSYTLMADGHSYLYTHGPGLLFLIAGYSYMMLVVGSYILLRSVWGMPKVYRRQIYVLIAGIITPLIFNIWYLTGKVPIGIDPTPMVSSLTGVFFLDALLQFQLLDIVPIARHTVVETMRDGVIVLDYKGRIVDINPGALSILGPQEDLVIGKIVTDHLKNLPDLTRMIKDHNPKTYQEMELPGLFNQYMEIKIVPVYRNQKNKDEDFAGQIITLRDVTERKRFQDEIQKINQDLRTQLIVNEELRARLEELAVRDSLTGLHNRRLLDDTIEREIIRAKRSHHNVSILMLDIDYFKRLNDTYGHKAGDAALIKLAQFLLAQARADDFVCRYGGEEFIMVMPRLNQEDALKRAEEICRAVSTLEINFEKLALKMTISIGVAQYPDHGNTSEEVIRAADSALYEAKHNGRNQAHLYHA